MLCFVCSHRERIEASREDRGWAARCRQDLAVRAMEAAAGKHRYPFRTITYSFDAKFQNRSSRHAVLFYSLSRGFHQTQMCVL